MPVSVSITPFTSEHSGKGLSPQNNDFDMAFNLLILIHVPSKYEIFLGIPLLSISSYLVENPPPGSEKITIDLYCKDNLCVYDSKSV